MSTKSCNKCGATDLVWAQSKKGNWYLAVEKKWQGDMSGAIRAYYPAHVCNIVEVDDEDFNVDAQMSKMFDAGYPGII